MHFYMHSYLHKNFILAKSGCYNGDDAFGLHWVNPPIVKHKIGLHELIVLPSKLLEDRVWHQVDGSAAINEHPGEQPSIDVTSNV
jgi:hypothetical protein